KFARPRKSGPERQRLLQQRIEHIDAAMALQLQHVFAGEGMRTGKEQRQTFVDDVGGIRVMKRGVVCVTGCRLKMQQLLCDGQAKRAGNAHDTHTTSSGWCGYRTDGVVVSL